MNQLKFKTIIPIRDTIAGLTEDGIVYMMVPKQNGKRAFWRKAPMFENEREINAVESGTNQSARDSIELDKN